MAEGRASPRSPTTIKGQEAVAPTAKGDAARRPRSGAALDLAVDTLERIGRADLGAVLLGEAHGGEHGLAGLAGQGGELGQLGPDLIGDLAPLGPGGVGVVPSAAAWRRPFQGSDQGPAGL